MAERVPQPFLIGIYGIEVTPEMVRILRETDAAGVHLLRRNIESPGQVRTLLSALEAELGYRLLASVEHDGGRTSPFARGVTFFPGFAALVRAGIPRLAYEVGRALGRELRAMGFDLHLAPVIDLEVVEPAKARLLAGDLQKGLRESGIEMLTRLEGFPGVGVADVGSRAGEEAVVRSIQEGKTLCLLLHDEDFIRRAAHGLKNAVAEGSLSRDAYDAGVARVQALLARRRTAPDEPEEMEAPAGLAESVAAASVTVHQDPLKLLPIEPGRRAGMLVPRLADVADRVVIDDELRGAAGLLQGRVPPVQVLEVPVEPDAGMMGLALDWAAGLETVVFFCFDARRISGQRKLLEALQRRCPRIAVVLIGGAGDRELVEGKATLVTTDGFRMCQLSAAIDVLFRKPGRR